MGHIAIPSSLAHYNNRGPFGPLLEDAGDLALASRVTEGVAVQLPKPSAPPQPASIFSSVKPPITEAFEIQPPKPSAPLLSASSSSKASKVGIALLGVSAILAILTNISAIGSVAGLALRSVNLLSCGYRAGHSWSIGAPLSCVNECLRVAVVALGIIGLTANLPTFTLAALGLSIFTSLIDLAKSKSFLEKAAHFSQLIVNTLMLVGVAAFLPQLSTIGFILGTTVSCSIILSLGLLALVSSGSEEKEGKRDYHLMLQGLCILALGGAGFAGLLQWVYQECDWIKYHYTYHNSSNHAIAVQDRAHHTVTTVGAGQTAKFEVGVDRWGQNLFADNGTLRPDYVDYGSVSKEMVFASMASVPIGSTVAHIPPLKDAD